MNLSILHCLLFTIIWGNASLLLADELPQISDKHRTTAESLYYQGNYQEALKYYEKAYNLVEQKDKIRAANLCVDISTIYYSYGQYQQATNFCYLGSLHLKNAAAHQDSVQFKIYSSLGEMYRVLGKRDSCLWFFDQGNRLLDVQIHLQEQIPAYVLYHYNNQGLMYVRTGNYTQGIHFLTKALQIAEATSSKNEASVVRNNLALLHERRGNFDKGLQLRLRASAEYSEEDYQKCLIFSGIGWNLMETSRYEEALQHLNRSYQLYRRLVEARHSPANPYFEANLLNNFGNSYSGSDMIEKAESAFTKAVNIFQDSYGRYGKILAESYSGLAAVQAKKENYSEALSSIDQAIASCHIKSAADTSLLRVVYEKTLFESLSFRGEIIKKQHKLNPDRLLLAEVLRTYQKALVVADQLRRSYNSPEASLYFQATIYPVYEKAFETAYELFSVTEDTLYKEVALRILEKSRASVLSDAVRELAIRPRYIPQDLLEQERNLQEQITSLKYKQPTASGAMANNQKLIDMEIKLARLLGEFEQKYPAYYQAKYSKPDFSVRLLQQKLDEHTAYLTYQWKAPFLYIGSVTRQTYQLHRVQIKSKEWEKHTQLIRQILYQNPGLGNYKGILSAIHLYRWLIEPVIGEIADKKRLVISRDAALNWLPLEVLETGKTTDDFLGKRKAISYTYTAMTYINTQENSAIADKKIKTLCFAPYTANYSIEKDLNRSGMGYLPASENEVNSIGGSVFTGKNATKDQFLQYFSSAPIVHLATHAQTNDQEPANSFIAFYPENDYHKLFTEEIYLLNCRNTRLVVLSACETGRGKVHQGEGLMSLARAFSFAGCPSVATTIWKSHDKSMAYLSQRFHQYIREGMALDVALYKARLDFFNSDFGKQFNHPYYWANFIILGDTAPVYQIKNNSYMLASAVMFTLLLLASIGIIYKRKAVFSGRNTHRR